MRAEQLGGAITGPRPGRMRDRRGRGSRGPVALPGPLSQDGLPLQRTPRERFDEIVRELVDLLEPHFTIESDQVDVVVEDVPLLPSLWDEPVPLGAVVRETTPVRVVVYRVPISQRCSSEPELRDMAWTAVLDGLSEVWSIPPEKLDPRR